MAADAAEERLREQLYGAFKHRALLYYRIFDEMRRALGEAQQPGRDGCCHLHIRPGKGG